MKRYDEAVEVLKKALADKAYRQPQFPYFNLGICMRKQGRNQEAIAAFNRVIQLDPEFYRAYVALAETYKEAGDYEKALYFYQKAEPGFNNSVDILFEIGRAMFQLRQYDKAKSYLAQVSILFSPAHHRQTHPRHVAFYRKSSKRNSELNGFLQGNRR